MTDLPAELRKNPPLGPGAVFFGLGAGFYRPNLAELTHLSCTNTYNTSFPPRDMFLLVFWQYQIQPQLFDDGLDLISNICM